MLSHDWGTGGRAFVNAYFNLVILRLEKACPELVFMLKVVSMFFRVAFLRCLSTSEVCWIGLCGVHIDFIVLGAG